MNGHGCQHWHPPRGCCCGPPMGHPPMGHFRMEMSPEEEAEALKNHRQMLQKRLERIEERLKALEA